MLRKLTCLKRSAGARTPAALAAISGSPTFGWLWGAFAVCCGWVILSTRLLGRWLGWWVIASGIGLAISRFSWTLEFWFFRTSPSGSG